MALRGSIATNIKGKGVAGGVVDGVPALLAQGLQVERERNAGWRRRGGLPHALQQYNQERQNQNTRKVGAWHKPRNSEGNGQRRASKSHIHLGMMKHTRKIAFSQTWLQALLLRVAFVTLAQEE